MSEFQPEAFVSLCEKLRALGATKVEAGGFRADFGPHVPRAAAAEPVSSDPKEAILHRIEKKRELAATANDEALKELARKKELGLR